MLMMTTTQFFLVVLISATIGASAGVFFRNTVSSRRGPDDPDRDDSCGGPNLWGQA